MRAKILQGIVALLAGVLFAIGLVVGGMTEPANVIGFLDVTGEWRPALAFVMVGAILVNGTAWLLIRRKRAPLLAPSFSVPKLRELDPRLLIGSAIFGVGWGLGGFCPGPGVVATMSGALTPIVFATSMLVGTWIAISWERSSAAARERSEAGRTRIEGRVRTP